MPQQPYLHEAQQEAAQVTPRAGSGTQVVKASALKPFNVHPPICSALARTAAAGCGAVCGCH